MNTLAFLGVKQGITARQIFVFDCIHGVKHGITAGQIIVIDYIHGVKQGIILFLNGK